MPPALVETSPEEGAVNVSPSEIRFTFSEYVDQNAFSQAFSINPEPDGRLEFDWSGRSVEVELPENLRPNTTYILTLDTNLRDIHSVKLSQPITLAFSTGPRINRGRLAGQVVQAATGRPVSGIDIFAYAAPDSLPPDSLPARPDYRIQTDAGGRFQLDYLNEGPYFVIALADRNRSRAPDVREAFAPPPRPILLADSTGTDSSQVAPLPTWFTTATDSAAPTLLEARVLSTRRLVLRYPELVRLEGDLDVWSLSDSANGEAVPLVGPYTREDAPQQVFLLVRDSLRETTYLGRTSAVVDTSGNVTRDEAFTVTSSDEDADTTRLRFTSFFPNRIGEAGAVVLGPEERFGIRFNQPTDSAALQAMVAIEDTSGDGRAFIAATSDGTAYDLTLSPPLGPGQTVRIAVAGAAVSVPDTTYQQTFQRVAESELGILSGGVALPDTGSAVVVELYASGQAADSSAFEPYTQTAPDAEGRFLFEGLPQGLYRFRVFLDRNGNQQWDGGRITPYEQPEPLTWASAPAWRARWESALEDTLRLPIDD
ncbi:MAG: Ig-like domain-containing protein [Rhodothermales bacterium]